MKVNTTPSLLTRIQYATNITTTNWITLTNYTTSAGTFNYTNNNAGPGTNRIYRGVNIF